MKIVVAGGGYAGLSCLMEIADRLPDAERVLVDPSRWHLRQTRLQEALRRLELEVETVLGDLLQSGHRDVGLRVRDERVDARVGHVDGAGHMYDTAVLFGAPEVAFGIGVLRHGGREFGAVGGRQGLHEVLADTARPGRERKEKGEKKREAFHLGSCR